MRYLHRLLPFVSLAVILASCTIENDIYFEKDFSGRSETTIHVEELYIAMAALEGDTSLTGDDLAADKAEFMREFIVDSQELFTEIEQLAGTENFSYEVDSVEMKLNMSFTFNEVEDLNRIRMSSSEDETDHPAFYIGREGKEIQYYVEAMAEEMQETLHEITTLHFKHKVKSCSLPSAAVTKHTVRFDNKDVETTGYITIILK